MKVDPLILEFERYMGELARGPEEDMLAAAYASPAVHFALYCRIKDDDNREIDPMPNILQLRMNEAYETIKAMGIRVRIIITKPRRAGCSSFVEHIGYHEAMKSPINGMTIADDKEGSKAAMNKLASFETMDSYPWSVSIISNPAHSITWSNGSTWTVDTAENADAGAGDTLHFFHGTEVSKWPKTTVKNDKKVMSCVTPALSGLNTAMFCESTPEGAEGWQFETWDETAVTLDELLEMHAKGICPEEVWVKVFAAWFEFTKNRRQKKVSEREIEYFKATLDDTEKEEIEKYGLDWEQIGWRRDTIASKCGGDPKVFSYYYPSDPESCWLASGRPRFDMSRIVAMEHRARMVRPETGFLAEQQGGRVGFQVMHDGSGDIQIWERPRVGCRYVVCIDPATDETQTIGADPDRHSVAVWRQGFHDPDTDTWRKARKVARVKPPYYADGDEVAGHAVRLSRFYGNAMVAQEVNVGLDILRLIRVAGCPVYKRRPLSHRTGEITPQFGFRLNDQQERNALIESFAAAIREDAIEVECEHTLKEYKKFVVKPKGRAEAASGHHDDDVMCDAMAWEVLPSAGEYRAQSVKRQDPPDRGRGGWRSVNNVSRGW